MPKAQHWMFPKHPWSGVTHDLFNLFTSVPLIAMDRAFGASRFILAKTAAFKSQIDIPLQFGALRAEGILVMIAAIDMQHCIHRSPFTIQTTITEIDHSDRA